jgi:hypothetical protein
MVTLARAWRRQPEQSVELVVWEPSIEGIARHLLLLSIMLDTQLTARGKCPTRYMTTPRIAAPLGCPSFKGHFLSLRAKP